MCFKNSFFKNIKSESNLSIISMLLFTFYLKSSQESKPGNFFFFNFWAEFKAECFTHMISWQVSRWKKQMVDHEEDKKTQLESLGSSIPFPCLYFMLFQSMLKPLIKTHLSSFSLGRLVCIGIHSKLDFSLCNFPMANSRNSQNTTIHTLVTLIIYIFPSNKQL